MEAREAPFQGLHVDSVAVANVLSFGADLQKLDGLRRLNLLIGRNGAGKSNLFRLLGDPPIELRPAHGRDNSVPVFEVWLELGARHRHIQAKSTPTSLDAVYEGCVLEVDFRYVRDIGEGQISDRLTFLDGRLRSGEPSALSRQIELIDLADAKLRLHASVGKLAEQNSLRPQIVSFAPSHIFDRDYRLLSTGTLIEHEVRAVGADEISASGSWAPGQLMGSSGVVRCAWLVAQALLSSADAMLVEEPEIHLEPHAQRRLLEILAWLSLAVGERPTGVVGDIKDRIDAGWKSWLERFDPDHRTADELPHPTGHPRTRQLFLATHSNVLIDTILRVGDFGSIHEFNSTSSLARLGRRPSTLLVLRPTTTRYCKHLFGR